MLEVSCQQLRAVYESWRQSRGTGFREERAALGLNQPVGQSPSATLKQLQHRAAPSLQAATSPSIPFCVSQMLSNSLSEKKKKKKNYPMVPQWGSLPQDIHAEAPSKLPAQAGGLFSTANLASHAYTSFRSWPQKVSLVSFSHGQLCLEPPWER